MANDRLPAQSARFASAGLPSSSRSVLSRSQSPEEAIADMYVGLARVHAIGGVTQYAAEMIRSVDAKRRDIVEEFPETQELIWGLEVNAARLAAGVQNSMVNDHRDVIA